MFINFRKLASTNAGELESGTTWNSYTRGEGMTKKEASDVVPPTYITVDATFMIQEHDATQATKMLESSIQSSLADKGISVVRFNVLGVNKEPF